MKEYIKIIKHFFCVILFLIPQVKLFAHSTEEVVVTTASSYIIQTDPILKSRYNDLNKKFSKGDDEKLILNKTLELIEEAKKSNNIEVIILSNFLIGKIFEKVDNYKRAIDYYKSSLKLLELDEFEENNLKFNEEIGDFYVKLLLKLAGNYQDLKDNNNALFFYNKILEIQSLNKEVLTNQAMSYGNISAIYLSDSNYEKAKEFSLKAIEIHKSLKNKISASFALNNLANIYLVEDNYEEARKTYEEAIGLIKFESSDRAIKHKEDLYFNYAYTLYKLKDYEAYTYQELSYNIKDSIRDKGFRKAVEEIYAINNVEKFKKEEAIRQSEATKKMWLIVFSSGTLIIALLFLIGYFRLRQRNLSLKLKQTELIQNQKIERLRSISQKRILNKSLSILPNTDGVS